MSQFAHSILSFPWGRLKCRGYSHFKLYERSNMFSDINVILSMFLCTHRAYYFDSETYIYLWFTHIKLIFV